MRIGVLGPVGVVAGTAGGGSFAISPVGSHSQRLVLGVLASRRGETIDSDVLVEALWPAGPPRTASQTLRTYVSRLRSVLGEAVAIRPGGYALDVPAIDVDAGCFERLLAEAAHASRPEAAVLALEAALALWRGPAFGDLSDAEVLRGPARRLSELRHAAQEDLAVGWLRAGDAARAAAAAEALVEDHPLREGAWVVLIDALAAAGRAPEALRAYQRAGTALAGAGLVPSARLRQAERCALDAPAAPRLAPRPFPASAATLIGRAGALGELEVIFTSARLVTVCGPGGVGKTRLAMALADRISPRFRWGARFVALAPVDDSAAVPAMVADALGLAVEDGGPEAALSRAGPLDLLVVLDNCEHVVDAAARVAEAVLAGGGRARILATSRERLAVDGEHVRVLEPLSLAGDDPPARRMFVERARAVRPDAVATPADLAAAGRIVARLDGLPLAIEMAAGRAGSLPVAQVADRLDRLDELGSTRRHAEGRHRTLAAVVEWSEALLKPDDRDLLAEMSVFAGSIGDDDVAAVTGRPAPLDALTRLAERSLLVVDTGAGRARFRMLATIRDHAARSLAAAGRADHLAARHAEHVVTLAAAADAGLRTRTEGEAAGRLESLLPELRTAWRWAQGADRRLAVQVCAATHVFAHSRIRNEPLGWAETIAGDLEDGPDRAAVLAAAAQRAVNAGDLAHAEALAERGVVAAGPAGDACYPLAVLHDIAIFTGRFEQAAAAAVRMLAAGEALGDEYAVTFARTGIAAAAAQAGQRDEALDALGGRWDPPQAPSNRGWLAYTEGETILDHDPPRALEALGRAIALADEARNPYLGGVARLSDCSLRSRVGDPDAAREAFAAVIELWRRRGAQVLQLTTLRNVVVLLARMGCAAEAAQLLGAVSHDPVAPTFGDEAARLDAARKWAGETLGHDETRRHLAAGARLSLDEAAETALNWLGGRR